MRNSRLSGWPESPGRWWSRSVGVRSHGTLGITRGAGPASRGLGEASCVWPTWSPFMTGWPAWWIRGKAVGASAWTSARPLVLSPQYSPGEAGSPCSDRCTLCWLKNWLYGQAQSVVVNGIISRGWLVTSGVPRAQHWGQSCAMSLSLIGMRGLRASSVNLWNDAKLGEIVDLLVG